MKRKVTTIMAAVGVFLTLAMGSAIAQIPTGAEVNIPFDFAAGKANLKAGTYIVKRGSGDTLQIRSADGTQTILVNAPLTIGSRDYKAGQRLVFNRYGDQYFLTQVWFTVDQGKQLFPTKAETAASRELARRRVTPQRIDVAVRSR